ncbi:hypothetical protein GCM10011571_05690 [Marinithermofilum abyssi]|uniref:Apolipoprotein N-acyltransferase n=1 Tax=Marinithermofilum abyssi TaxID=1571185 RepID=A0A8J2VEE8_9BACL|nr:hypothetical protein [Marinithermofilum abyssi]GGE07302.1 hypothetical protein GCM10011571_05690 [Marinithermofilum abyssi]
MLFWIGGLFWSLLILSVLFTVYAFYRQHWGWMLTAIMLYLPFIGYFHGTPRFQGALFIVVFFAVAAVWISFQRRWLSFLFLLPVLLYTGWILHTVYTEQMGTLPLFP